MGSLRWKRKVPGVVVGTPVIGTDGMTVYISQNSKDRGSVIILSDDNGGKVISRETDALFGHYGPLTLNKVNGKDFVYWGEMNGRGYSDTGRIHYLDTSTQIHHIGNNFGSSSAIPPTISSDSTSMWVGGRSATVYGWIEGNFKDNPSWTTQLQLSQRNHSYRKLINCSISLILWQLLFPNHILISCILPTFQTMASKLLSTVSLRIRTITASMLHQLRIFFIASTQLVERKSGAL